MRILEILNPSSRGDYMKSVLRKIGNSRGIIIPKTLIDQYDLDQGVEFISTPEGVLLKKVTKIREGWADAAKEIAVSGERHAEWDNVAEDDWQEEW